MPNTKSTSEFALNADGETNFPLDIYREAVRRGQLVSGFYQKNEE